LPLETMLFKRRTRHLRHELGLGDLLRCATNRGGSLSFAGYFCCGYFHIVTGSVRYRPSEVGPVGRVGLMLNDGMTHTNREKKKQLARVRRNLSEMRAIRCCRVRACNRRPVARPRLWLALDGPGCGHRGFCRDCKLVLRPNPGHGRNLARYQPDRRMATSMRAAIESEGDQLADLHLWRLGPGHLGAFVSVVTKHARNTDY
jgi:hypothetical protein